MPSPQDALGVVAVILAGDPELLSETLDAVRAQVYGPPPAVVVGGDAEARRVAEAAAVPWRSSIDAAMRGLGPEVGHVWFVRAGVRPRRDALGALVVEAVRLDVGIAGSKVLDRDDPRRLVSVGFATDVFDVPYTGLDDDEVDQGQYDVIRDVAAVSGASMLIRRDLVRGLRGPDPAMASSAASVDLCQRARLLGARVVVVPSSVVTAPPPSTAPRWREDAGRIRAMVKAYGALTLLWVLPGAFLVGLAVALAELPLGRWRLFDWVRAWAWNLVRLPSTIARRRRARRSRVVGDAELFRYQTRGSVELRRVARDLGDRVRARWGGEGGDALEALGREVRRPGFVAATATVLFVLAAVRSLWTAGLPAVGYTLPFPPSPTAVLRVYAGGWNPAGLGSPTSIRPITALAAVVDLLVPGPPRAAEWVLVGGALLLAVWGTVRLVNLWGVGPLPGAVAGIVVVAGPAAGFVAGSGAVDALVGLGLLPYALRLLLGPPARSWRALVGGIAAAAAIVGLVGVAFPVLLAAPLTVAVVATALDPRSWRAVPRGIAATVLGAPLLLPWIAEADADVLRAGAAFWEPNPVVVGAFGVVAVAGLLAVPRRLAVPAAVGTVLAVAGAGLARAATLPEVGREPALAGAAVASVGVGLTVAAVLAGVAHPEARRWRRWTLGIGTLGAVTVAATALVVLLGGRAGLPGDRLTGALDFTMARAEDPSASRILLVGDPEALPGDRRSTGGDAVYRLVSAPVPGLWEAWLAPRRAGDDALEEVLGAMLDGTALRGGEELEPFGIRWIVVLGDGEHAAAWQRVLGRQLDLLPLGGGLRAPAYENEATPAVRSHGETGRAWIWTGDGYAGPAEQGRLWIAENADPRWTPAPWAQSSWGNEVAAEAGVARFSPDPRRRALAFVAAGSFLVLVGVAWAGRRWR